MHLIKSTLYRLFILFICLASLLVFLATTTPGLFLSFKIASYFLPGKLTLAGVKGRAIDHFSIEEFTYRDNKLQLTIEHADLHWRLQDLLKHQLTIKNLQSDELTLLLKTKEPPHLKLEDNDLLPALPFDIFVKSAAIKTIIIKKITPDVSTSSPRVSNPIKFFNLQGRLSKQKWQIHQLNFNINDHDFTLKAETDTSALHQINASLTIKNTQKLKPGIDGNFTIGGNFNRYHFRGQLKAPTSLVLEGTLLNGKELHTKARWQQLNWPINKTPCLKVEKGELSAEGTWPKLALNLQTKLYRPLQATLQINADTSLNHAHSHVVLTSAYGSINGDIAYTAQQTPNIQGTLNARFFEQETYNNLIKDVSIHSQFKGSSLDSLTLHSQINALYLDTPFNATLNLQKQNLTSVATLGTNRLQITGHPFFPLSLNANLPELALLHPSLKGLKTAITANALLSSEQKGTLTVKINKGKLQTPDNELPFEGGEIHSLLNEKQLTTKGTFTIDKHKNLQLNLILPEFHYKQFSASKQKINGHLGLSINSLSFLQELNSEISKATGQLKADVGITGTLAKPLAEGSLNLSNASLSLQKMGINLNPMQFSLQSHDKIWKAIGTLVSNGTPLTIRGEGDFLPTVKGLFAISGENVQLINTDEYTFYLSPKLSFEFAPSLLKIRGTVLVPNAQIKPKNFTDTVSLTDDAVFVSDAPPPNRHNLDTDVRVEMGKDVALSVKGLQGFLTGGVQLRQLPQKPLTAIGELSIRDGKYRAYGQDLVIDQGQLLFTGGLIENPGIHVRAIRKFSNSANSPTDTNQATDFGRKTTVGIEVNGRINSPKVQLFSIPSSLSQADILSMLLLGKPANQASKSGGQLLLTAVSALNLNSGNNGMQLLEQLKEKLGIDFNLENNSAYNQKTNQNADKTAFVVGKALSKRLYLSYNMGLSQTDSNVVTLKYLLTQMFSIQVNASMTGSGIDLLYTHEKD
jgi:translocation and assembly module TamB